MTQVPAFLENTLKKGVLLAKSLNKRTILYILCLGLALVLLLSRCVDGKKPPMMPPAPLITVQEILLKDVPLEYEYAGRAAGSREIEIRSRINGIILERTYIEGQSVNKDDVLFKIDPGPYQAKLSQAQSRLKEIQANFQEAKKNWERILGLFDKKIASTREKDQAQSAYEQAVAKVQGADADVKSAQIDLDYTTVKAPISGITSQEACSEGSLITSTADHSLLTRIVQIDPIYVNFSYSENEVLRQRHLMNDGKQESLESKKLVATMQTGDKTVPLKTGYVDFTDSFVDIQTGTVRARAVFPNPEKNLLPGQFVRITVSGISQPNAIILPKRAIMQSPEGTFVFIVNGENKADIRPVILGLSTSQGQIIDKGLEKGDVVIVEGMIKVRPGQLVQIEKDRKKAENQIPEPEK
jgi:membrane fusion protein (multidrug efflux system)